MSTSLTKLWNDYGIGALVVLLAVAFGVNYFATYLTGRGMVGPEMMSGNGNSAYRNGAPRHSNGSGNSKGGVKPAEPLGQNEVFAQVKGIQTPEQGVPTSCSSQNIQNPSDLLPADSNNQWGAIKSFWKG